MKQKYEKTNKSADKKMIFILFKRPKTNGFQPKKSKITHLFIKSLTYKVLMCSCSGNYLLLHSRFLIDTLTSI